MSKKLFFVLVSIALLLLCNMGCAEKSTAPDTQEYSTTGNPDTIPGQPIRLSQNYPNPFYGYTTINYHLSEACEVKLDILDSRKVIIKHLIYGLYPAGTHSVFWNGKNNQQQYVQSGIYTYRLIVGSTVLEKQMILFR